MSRIPAMNATAELPGDLIVTTEACKLVPGRLPGKRLHAHSLYRWILGGKLRAWRCQGLTYVSRGELLAMFLPLVRPAVRTRTGRG